MDMARASSVTVMRGRPAISANAHSCAPPPPALRSTSCEWRLTDWKITRNSFSTGNGSGRSGAAWSWSSAAVLAVRTRLLLPVLHVFDHLGRPILASKAEGNRQRQEYRADHDHEQRGQQLRADIEL